MPRLECVEQGRLTAPVRPSQHYETNALRQFDREVMKTLEPLQLDVFDVHSDNTDLRTLTVTVGPPALRRVG
jgi:hypothetical protein